MFNVGGGELLVIMLVALIVLGPQRLPDAARQVGKVMGDLRRISSGFQQELKDALDDGGAAGPPRRSDSVPLASTVSEADRSSTRASLATGPHGSSPDEGGVAPAVAAALDEVVTPLDGSPGEPAGPGLDGRRDGGDDALGDERAAS